MTWTQERINLLVKLWIGGKSASLIAKELGDITRNAVIGKVHRLGISNRDTILKNGISKEKILKKDVISKKICRPVKNIIEHKKITIRNPVLPARPSRLKASASHQIPLSENYIIASILDLNEKTCKWPIGHPDEVGFHFCGCTSVQSGPYCTYHMAVAYTQVSRRENNGMRDYPKPEKSSSPVIAFGNNNSAY